MINERMLEYLMLADILSTLNSGEIDINQAELLDKRYALLRDEFIKEHKSTLAEIKNPLKDTTKET